MATRVCPECGSQYVASVRTCIDCDVALVDQVDPDAPAAAPAPLAPSRQDEQVEYELAGWGTSLKESLEGMLDRAGIRRAWEANALVVPAVFEAEVDRLVATLEVGVEELSDDVAQVAFEIEVLEPDELSDLDARLIAAHLPHAWDGDGSLLVAEDDEDEVSAIIDEVLASVVEEEVDGLAVQEALSTLYVTVDRLMKDADDVKQRGRFLQAADAIVGFPLPYGLSDADWGRLTSDVAALADAVRPPVVASGPDDEVDFDTSEIEAGEEEIEAPVRHGADAEDTNDDDTDDHDTDDEGDDDGAEESGPSVAEQARSLRGRLQELV